jgi:RNA recognition motif-containing protein
VKFIPNEVTEAQLREKFTLPEGNILSTKLEGVKKRYKDTETTPYQYAFILYDTVSAAQKAIQRFDGQYVFGSHPLAVEMWASKEEKEQERKKKDDRQVKQLINALVQSTMPSN